MYQLSSKVAGKDGKLIGYNLYNASGNIEYVTKGNFDNLVKNNQVIGVTSSSRGVKIARGIDCRLGWTYTLEDGSFLTLSDINPFGIIVIDKVHKKGVDILIVLTSDATENKDSLKERVFSLLKSIGSHAECNHKFTTLKYSVGLKIKNCSLRDITLLLAKFKTYSSYNFMKDTGLGYIKVVIGESKYMISANDLICRQTNSGSNKSDLEASRLSKGVMTVIEKSLAKYTDVFKILKPEKEV